VKNRAVYVAIGVNLEGTKEVLGLWSSDNGLSARIRESGQTLRVL
jgi:transposase-like protein